jgi:hypothetical protein
MAQDYIPDELAENDDILEAIEKVMISDFAVAYESSMHDMVDSDGSSEVEPSQSTEHVSAEEEPQIDPCLTKAFPDDNLKLDSLRCPHWAEPSTEHINDRIHYLIREYALTIRFGRLHVHQFKMTMLN